MMRNAYPRQSSMTGNRGLGFHWSIGSTETDLSALTEVRGQIVLWFSDLAVAVITSRRSLSNGSGVSHFSCSATSSSFALTTPVTVAVYAASIWDWIAFS